jgi:hypothetical protein
MTVNLLELLKDSARLGLRLPQIVFKWSQDGSIPLPFDEQGEPAERLFDGGNCVVEIAIQNAKAAALACLDSANPPASTS